MGDVPVADEWTNLNTKLAQIILNHYCHCYGYEKCVAELVSYIKDYVKVRRFGGITPDWICKEKIQPDVNAFLDCRINSILERERKKREKEENATERKR